MASHWCCRTSPCSWPSAVVGAAGFFAYAQADPLLSETSTVEDYNSNLEEKWNWLRDDSIAAGAVQNWAGSENATLAEGLSQIGLVGSSGQISDIVVNMLAGVGDMISASLIITFFLIFMILEAALLPARIERAWPSGGSAKLTEVREQIESSVNTYVIVKTGVSIGTAVGASVLMISFGIDLWFTWALLTFLFNYVPYIGSVFAMIPPLILGAVMLGPAHC